MFWKSRKTKIREAKEEIENTKKQLEEVELECMEVYLANFEQNTKDIFQALKDHGDITLAREEIVNEKYGLSFEVLKGFLVAVRNYFYKELIDGRVDPQKIGKLKMEDKQICSLYYQCDDVCFIYLNDGKLKDMGIYSTKEMPWIEQLAIELDLDRLKNIDFIKGNYAADGLYNELFDSESGTFIKTEDGVNGV